MTITELIENHLQYKNKRFTDSTDYVAHVSKLKLYSYGSTEDRALENMKSNILDLHQDFVKDSIDTFNDEWKKVRKYLLDITKGILTEDENENV